MVIPPGGKQGRLTAARPAPDHCGMTTGGMTTSTAPSTNDLETALAHTRNLLARDPALAQEQALEILAVHPGHPEALRLRAASLRRLGRAQEALVLLDPMLRRWPHWPLVHSEIGQALAAAGQSAGAVAALEHAVKLDANLSEAWRALGDLHRLAGDIGKSDFAYGRHIATSVNDPRLREAAIALYDGKLAVAEPLLRTHLKAHPTDVAAIRMLAELAGRLGRFPDSENLLRRAVELAPGFTPARANLATVLQRQSKSAEALEVVEQLLEADAGNPSYLFLRSAALVHIGEFEKAIDTFEQVLGAYPRQSKGWMSYGHALKTVGRLDDSIAAYRRSLEIAPGLGEVWWSLANLKRFRFDETDIAAMKAALGRDDLGPEDRFHIEFALGKAEEDRGRAAESMAHYGEGNRLRREQIDYDADETTRSVDRARAFFTPDFYAAREGWGHPARDPIFVLGMPRAGSTLVEQILASHSRIEGTMELPDIPAMVRRVGGRGRIRRCPRSWPACPPRRFARSGRATSTPPASSARPTGRISSTSCPTTGCTSG